MKDETMTHEWWTETTYEPLTAEPHEEILAGAVAGLPGFGMITTAPTGVRINSVVTADTIAGATTAGLTAAHDAAGVLGVTAGPLAVHVVDATTREAELDHPASIDLVGVTEIANLLGVARQRAGRVTDLDDFPEPVGTVSSGRVWSRASVERFNERWQRQPGRPAKP